MHLPCSIHLAAERKITLMPVRFHLPGLRYNFPLNMMWISLLETHPEYFREGVEIASVFGSFPLSLWNGGRFVGNDQCDQGFVRNVIGAINAKGIPVRFTYTNPVLTESDLDDPFCNFCMRAGDNGMNHVLVFSEVLESYIRQTYPSYRVDSSTCKELRDMEELKKELDRDYTYVVLDYNLNNDFAVLEELPHKDKVEVLVNAICEPHCKRRGEHYETIGKNTRIAVMNRKLSPDKQVKPIPWFCTYGENNTFATIQKYSTFVSPELIWQEYVPRGITNFKIEGRTANIFMLVEEYAYYMIKPEHQSEARLLVLRNLEKSHVISVNRPKAAPFTDPDSPEARKALRKV